MALGLAPGLALFSLLQARRRSLAEHRDSRHWPLSLPVTVQCPAPAQARIDAVTHYRSQFFEFEYTWEGNAINANSNEL